MAAQHVRMITVIAYPRLFSKLSQLCSWAQYRDSKIFLLEVEVHRADGEFVVEHLDVILKYHVQKREYLAIIPVGLKDAVVC